jgi:hypothetical protein
MLLGVENHRTISNIASKIESGKEEIRLDKQVYGFFRTS